MAKKKVRRGNTERWDREPVMFDTTFEKYYRAQGIIDESDFEPLLAAFREPLPTTFRVTGSSDIAPALNNVIKTVFVPFLTGLEHEGVALNPPQSLTWYPKGYAWQLNVAKKVIRKNEAFRKFQNFLVYETDSGNISRQEAVSMIPPLLLAAHPDHYILDMCAAPGSKTSQLLEALHTFEDGTPKGHEPTGILLANDSDYKRCYLLVHQSLRRIPSPSMLVSNHDASQLPTFRVANPTFDGKVHRKNWRPLRFDRILCDVPCTGDGTLRKNPAIWNKWQAGIAFGLHPLQLRILSRGIQLLKNGGRLVYSTCSLNPIENEAVVSAALAKHPDMHIVDVSSELPELVRRPGVAHWRVLDNQLNELEFPDASEAAGRPVATMKNGKPVHRTLFPESNPNVQNLGLEHCLRVYPHLQDTGGFFVCVLEKDAAPEEEDASASASLKRSQSKTLSVNDEEDAKKPKLAESETSAADEAKLEEEVEEVEALDPKESEKETEQPDVQEAAAALASVSDVAGIPTHIQPFREAPFIYLKEEDDQVKIITEFFDLSSNFPKNQLLVRNQEGLPLRSIYMTSPLSRNLLTGNDHYRLRMVSCGVKLFTRQDNNKDTVYNCKWRVLADGVKVLRPYMGPKRIVDGNADLLKLLMKQVHVTFEEVKDSFPDFHKRMIEMEAGSCVFECTSKTAEVDFEQHLILPIWRSRTNFGLMVEKVEKSALSLRLFGEDLTPHAPKAKQEKKAEEDFAS